MEWRHDGWGWWQKKWQEWEKADRICAIPPQSQRTQWKSRLLAIDWSDKNGNSNIHSRRPLKWWIMPFSQIGTFRFPPRGGQHPSSLWSKYSSADSLIGSIRQVQMRFIKVKKRPIHDVVASIEISHLQECSSLGRSFWKGATLATDDGISLYRIGWMRNLCRVSYTNKRIRAEDYFTLLWFAASESTIIDSQSQIINGQANAFSGFITCPSKERFSVHHSIFLACSRTSVSNLKPTYSFTCQYDWDLGRRQHVNVLTWSRNILEDIRVDGIDYVYHIS